MKTYVNKYDNNVFYIVLDDGRIIAVSFNRNPAIKLLDARLVTKLPEDITDSLSVSPYTNVLPIDPSAPHILPEIKKEAAIAMVEMHAVDCADTDRCYCEVFKILSEMKLT